MKKDHDKRHSKIYKKIIQQSIGCKKCVFSHVGDNEGSSIKLKIKNHNRICMNYNDLPKY
jgi:hypothetical protein